MGIIVTPKERDSASDLTRLEIIYSNGSIETPSRFVTRVDINAKDGIGVDIPLSRDRGLFLYEAYLNPDTIYRILNENGYLAESVLSFESFLTRVAKTGALKLIFPKFTRKGIDYLHGINEIQRNKIWSFFFNLISELTIGKGNMDGFIVQYSEMTSAAKKYIDSLTTPWIPVINIHDDERIVEKQLEELIQKPSSGTPFIGLTYSTFTRSNLAFNYIFSRLDRIHEGGKGIITVDAPRTAGRGEFDPDVSALHYSSFLVADISAERIYRGGKGRSILRIFEKGDLAVPVPQPNHNVSEHMGEESFLDNDPKLKALFLRMMDGKLSVTERDRATYLSRIHENIITGEEYKKMRASIVSDELLEYRKEKIRINRSLESEGI